MRTIKKWGWRLLLIVPILAVVGFVIWASTSADPMPEALTALASDERIAVATEPWLVFQPVDQEPATGLIFYPGGRVDPRAYAPTARAIAAEGYLVAIVPMPLNLAVFAPDRAQNVMAAFPEIERWAVGGHSLGGAMAARFAREHPEAVEGLLLWAAYPAEGDDLEASDLAVASIYGTVDGLASKSEIENSRERLPADTQWVEIAGGNHAQFGWYGPQSGDNSAAIGRTAQQETIINATLKLLLRLEGSKP